MKNNLLWLSSNTSTSNTNAFSIFLVILSSLIGVTFFFFFVPLATPFRHCFVFIFALRDSSRGKNMKNVNRCSHKERQKYFIKRFCYCFMKKSEDTLLSIYAQLQLVKNATNVIILYNIVLCICSTVLQHTSVLLLCFSETRTRINKCKKIDLNPALLITPTSHASPHLLY